ncbi:HEPN domain-containing protein [bacterium]|nr:HEPN domain-containing protein [bacterium]
MKKKDDLVKEWIRKADHDWGMAELALEKKPEYTDSICFHCQQTAEKYLKAYLVFLEVPFEKKHNLVYLLDLISGKQQLQDEFYDLVEKLDDYSVEIRYPDDSIEPSIEDAKEAIRIAKHLKEFVLSKINLP